MSEAVGPRPGNLDALAVKRREGRHFRSGHGEYLFELLQVAQIALQVGDVVQSIVGRDCADSISLFLHLFQGGGQRGVNLLRITNWGTSFTLPKFFFNHFVNGPVISILLVTFNGTLCILHNTII